MMLAATLIAVLAANVCLGGTPRFVSHRGDMAVARENTLAAVRRAHAHGVSGCEIDLRLDAAGAVRLGHDGLTADSEPFEPVARFMAETGMFPLLDFKEPEAVGPSMAVLKRYGLLDRATTIVYTSEESRARRALDRRLAPFLLCRRQADESQASAFARYVRNLREGEAAGAFLGGNDVALVPRLRALGYRTMFGSFVSCAELAPLLRSGADLLIVDDPALAVPAESKEGARETVVFNDGWESLDDEARWTPVTLPHDATAGRPYVNLADHGGQGYVRGGVFRYRKRWTSPETAAGERLSVRFDGVYMDSSVCVNGTDVGGRRNGYVPFEVPVEPVEATNVIEVSVRADSPNSRWNSGAGILRNVWLVRRRGFVVSPEDVAIRVVSVTNGCAELTVTSDVGTVVVPAEGRLIIRSPRMWSPDDPHLYDIDVVVRDGGGATSKLSIPYGIRTFAFTKDDGFLLNGRRVQIRGVCQHEGGPCVGPVLNTAVLEYGLREMKKIGVNAIRTTHNPFQPEFYALCDRMGFLVLDELFDEWREPKTPHGYSRFFDDEWRRDVETVVRRDRNHPSVILWSIGNEIPELAGRSAAHGPEGAVRTVREMHDLIRRLDGTRPVTAGLNGAPWADTNGVCRALDVVGLNYCAECYRDFRGTYAIFGSETAATYSMRDVYHYRDNGAGALEIVKSADLLADARSSIPWWGTEDLDQEATLLRQMESPWSAGEFTWCFFDYLGEGSHAECRDDCFWPAVSSSWGMYDFAGLPKDRAYLNRSCWTTNAMVHLLPDWTLAVPEGTKVPVWCYTSSEKVELFLNGKSQGMREKTPGKLHLEWSVPYEAGELRACAYRNGRIVATDVRRTAGAVAEVRQSVLFDDGRTFMVRFDAVDEKGTRVISCEDVVELKPVGCTLLAAANGSPLDHVLRSSPVRPLFRGSMAAWFVRQKPDARVACRVDSVERPVIY